MKSTPGSTSSTARKLLLMFPVLVLFAPAFQRQFTFIKERPLEGAFFNRKKPTFDSLSWVSWLNGSFQQDFTDQLEADIGFRNTLVRIHNQWQYMVFRKANADGVIVGKQGELFEEDYIRSALGEFCVGKQVWEDKALKLKAVSDSLQQIGKKLLIVLEPGKGSLYPERYPTKYKPDKSGVSNYQAFKSSLENYKVPLLDLNACFMEWKDTVSYALFPQSGTHWSYYGAALAADTLLKMLNHMIPDHIPQLKIKRLEKRVKPRHPDDDIWLAMNMLGKVPADNLIYPVLSFLPAKKAKLKTLTIGDSFFFYWLNDGIMEQAFDKGSFWYYNKHIWDHQGKETGRVQANMIATATNEHDLFIIMITERFHQNFAWKFDEQLYDLLFPGKRNHLSYFSNQIRTANTEFLRMVDEAKQQKISLSERIEKEAYYLMYQDYLLHPELYSDKEDMIPMLMMTIRNTPDWYATVAAKAAKQNIPVDEMLRMDAVWIYESKQKE